MKRVGWLSLALLSACAAEGVQGGRYACIPDGGESQCPGSWRCGLEGYCHELGDVSVKWRCVSETNCENGWQCGLGESRDAGECHDPQTGGAYACADDRHCTLGWHCGPAQRCYDRRVPVAHACRLSGSDCAEGWRCGLSGVCQDLDAGAAYLCIADAGPDDAWCERGWRCAPEGRCLDPAQDALGATPPLAVSAPVRINPLISTSPIERFAVSPFYESGPGQGRQTVAFVQDGLLHARITDARLGGSVRTFELGPWNAVAFAAMGSRAEEIAVVRKADEVSRVVVVERDGGVQMLALDSDGGDPLATTNYAAATRVRVGTAYGDLSPRVLTFRDAPDFFESWIGDRIRSDIAAGGYPILEFPDLAFPGAPNRLLDLVSIRTGRIAFGSPEECVFAVDTRGLWVSQGESFKPIRVAPFTSSGCDPNPTRRVGSLAPLGRDYLGVASTQLDGGGPQVAILDLRPMWSTFEGCEALAITQACDAKLPIDVHMASCAVCSGGTLLDFTLVADALGRPSAEVRCGGPDGGAAGFMTLSRQSPTACNRQFVDGEAGLFGKAQLVKAEQPVAGQVAWASLDGFIWAGSSALNATSLLFDRAASVVGRRGPADEEAMVFAQKLIGTVTDAGLLVRTGPAVLTGVTDQPEWILNENRELLTLAGSGEPRLIGVVGNSVTAFTPPFSAASATSGAAQVVVVAAGTAVFSGELNAALANQVSFATVEVRVVSPSAIRSIAFPVQPPAGVYLRGFAVTVNGVLRLTAETRTRWLLEEVPLPIALTPLEVWFEGSRGRVGFANGTVYSLPSRVPIAPPLPDGVIDYAQACGQQLALGNSGVFRLQAQAGKSLGEWKPLALPAGFAPGGFERGRIHGVGKVAYVFTRSGEAARLTFEGCATP